MKKINPNKNIIIALIIVIIIVTVLSITIARRAVSEKTNVVQSTVNDSIALVDRVIQAPFNFISRTVDNVQDLFTTYDENQRLKEKIDHYEELSQQTKMINVKLVH